MKYVLFILLVLNPTVLCAQNIDQHAFLAQSNQVSTLRNAFISAIEISNSRISALENRINSLSNKVSSLENTVSNFKHCADSNMLYMPKNGSADNNGCTLPKFGNNSFESVKSYSHQSSITSDWHSLCILSWSHDNTNISLSIAAGPNAENKYKFLVRRTYGNSTVSMMCFD